MRCSALTLIGFVLVGLSRISNADEMSDYLAVRAYAERGHLAEDRRDYTTARRNFEAAVQRFPKSALAYWHRGTFFFARNEYGAALRDFNQAIHLRPAAWMFTEWRGLTYAALGKYDLAFADFNRILNLPSGEMTQGVILNNRAVLEATCPDPHYRNVPQAIKDAQFAIRFGDRHYKASCLNTLAAAYAEAGDFGSAIKYEQEAIAAQTKDDKLSDANRALDSYQRHRPYRAVSARRFLIQNGGELK